MNRLFYRAVPELWEEFALCDPRWDRRWDQPDPNEYADLFRQLKPDRGVVKENKVKLWFLENMGDTLHSEVIVHILRVCMLLEGSVNLRSFALMVHLTSIARVGVVPPPAINITEVQGMILPAGLPDEWRDPPEGYEPEPDLVELPPPDDE